MTDEKMAPGQKPYTPEQRKRKDELIAAACEAEELFDLDELEAYADAQREEG